MGESQNVTLTCVCCWRKGLKKIINGPWKRWINLPAFMYYWELSKKCSPAQHFVLNVIFVECSKTTLVHLQYLNYQYPALLWWCRSERRHACTPTMLKSHLSTVTLCFAVNCWKSLSPCRSSLPACGPLSLSPWLTNRNSTSGLATGEPQYYVSIWHRAYLNALLPLWCSYCTNAIVWVQINTE